MPKQPSAWGEGEIPPWGKGPVPLTQEQLSELQDIKRRTAPPPKRAAALAVFLLLGLLGLVIGVPLAIVGVAAHIEVLQTVGAVGIVLAIVGVLLGIAQSKRARAKQLPMVVKALGLRFDAGDRLGIEHAPLPFPMFRTRRKRARNEVWGTYREMPVKAFDYMYELPSRYHDDTVSWASALVALGEIPAKCPPLFISPGSSLQPLTEGVPRWRSESIDFNERFTVSCADRRFATTFMDERLMEWLLDSGPRDIGYAVAGSYLVAVKGSQGDNVEESVLLLEAMHAFWSHVPKVVSSLYPGSVTTSGPWHAPAS